MFESHQSQEKPPIDEVIWFNAFLDNFEKMYKEVFEPRGFGKNTALQCYTQCMSSTPELMDHPEDEEDG